MIPHSQALVRGDFLLPTYVANLARRCVLAYLLDEMVPFTKHPVAHVVKDLLCSTAEKIAKFPKAGMIILSPPETNEQSSAYK